MQQNMGKIPVNSGHADNQGMLGITVLFNILHSSDLKRWQGILSNTT